MLEHQEMVDLLWAALMDSGHESQAGQLKRQGAKDLSSLVGLLSRMEREILDAQVHRAIALLKSTLGGKRTRQEFEEQCLKIQGLM